MNIYRIAAFAALLLASAVAPPQLYATIFVYTAIVDGPTEGTASLGTGTAQVDWDDALNTMRVQASFSGLSGTTTAAHIHATTTLPNTGTAGVATQTPSFSGFPLGVTSGSMDTTFDMTLAASYNASFITGNGGTVASARAALKAALDAEKSYFNIHSSMFGGGEIRGFLHLVPEPSTWALLVCGAVGVGLLARRRRLAVGS